MEEKGHERDDAMEEPEESPVQGPETPTRPVTPDLVAQLLESHRRDFQKTPAGSKDAPEPETASVESPTSRLLLRPVVDPALTGREQAEGDAATEPDPGFDPAISAPPVAPPAPAEPLPRFKMDRLDQADAAKLGIVGGRGVGKSYLFQAILYRTQSGIQSGALSYFLDGDETRLYSAPFRDSEVRRRDIPTFVRNYRSWNRLETTLGDFQAWYRLRLSFRTGILGRQRSSLDVEFFDASGERFFERALANENYHLWRTYLEARVMVFCLPLWAAFPAPGLDETELTLRREILASFETVAGHFYELRRLHGRTHPVRSILALTMADDRRCGLLTLRDRWIVPYMDRPIPVLRKLRTGGGVTRYLDNARRVSEALREEFENAGEPEVSRIPGLVDFHGGRPWLVPVSAIDGSQLELLESNGKAGRDGMRAPVPVHVELPLLLALCDRFNALM